MITWVDWKTLEGLKCACIFYSFCSCHKKLFLSYHCAQSISSICVGKECDSCKYFIHGGLW